ncbi:MAG: exonuclease domain-containing protein [Desulfuromonadales bacterium]|nr:exonuclease domain-containing protein [Desulfuromonadales bacterium]
MQKRFGDNLSPAVKYWIFLLGIILTIFGTIFGSFVASYLHLPAAEQQLARELFDRLLPFPFLGSLLLVVIICSLVSLIFRYYIIPVLRMAEQTRLITAANPEHRITTAGARELRILAEVINESADAYQALQAEIDLRVRQANQDIKQERNRLAALMSQLPYGVLVCNREGSILLYNRQAQQMLDAESDDPAAQSRFAGVGLGRSVFSLLEREPIVHMLEVMHQAHRHGQLTPAQGLMTRLCGRRFIRVNMAAMTEPGGASGDLSGFVLTLEDISAEVDAGNQRDRQLQSLIDAVQLSLGRIQGGVQNICGMPGVGGDACDRHRQAIQEMTDELEQHLALAREFYSQHRQGHGSRENVLGATLIDILARNLRERFDFVVDRDAGDRLWLQIDSYSIVQIVCQLAGRFRTEFSIDRLRLSIRADTAETALLVIGWPQARVPTTALADWQNAPLFMDSAGSADSPRTILARHGGAVRIDEPEPGRAVGIGLPLPLALTGEAERLPSRIPSRPISYEFDLFHQTVEQELADLPLHKLTFVAFDTETTGLNPSQGDEIIQLGAVRIVNGRLQPNEVVDQLVDPRRPVPAASVKVHGIDPDLLAGQPTIDEVLPRFHQFTLGAVLVAHNAAFDMRFLQLKEEQTGVCFDNPVLDTLHLSSLVHPNQEGHSLDDIAARFNLRITGRHTAFGDALVTAEVLLKLLPLLQAQGIVTLRDALQASAASKFVRLKY